MKPTRMALWSTLLAALLLAACSTPIDLSDKAAPVETRDTTGRSGGAAGTAAAGGASSGATPQSRVATVDLAAGGAAGAAAAGAPAQRVVHFDFDSVVIRAADQPVVDGHARYLAADRKRHVTIEGHTDERGGSEYNLALGQKRAEAVAKALELLGVHEDQIEAVSFGEERPVDPGHDETAWAKNRRAELKDR